MKTLYVGPLEQGGTSLQRLQALKELGHSLTSINSAPNWLTRHRRPPLYYRVLNKISGSPDFARANRQIRHWVRREKFDLLWVDKGLTISAKTLMATKNIQPSCVSISYNPDDIMNRSTGWKRYISCLPYYDFVITPRKCNIDDFRKLGAQNILCMRFAYDPHTHRPMDLPAEEKKRLGGPVGFIGGFEEQRAKSISFLAEQGIQVGVWGDGWEENCKLSHSNLHIKGPSIYGDDYARAICSFDICLGFLRKRNRDLQTTRSFEIPACGVFMLAERTSEHLELFEEGKEAEFFGDDEELLEKVKFYSAHESERKQIAQAGRERCLRSGYSNHQRLKEILSSISAHQG
ncbi:MAG: glycosyltransferase [Desulfobaccales bacterium]